MTFALIPIPEGWKRVAVVRVRNKRRPEITTQSQSFPRIGVGVSPTGQDSGMDMRRAFPIVHGCLLSMSISLTALMMS